MRKLFISADMEGCAGVAAQHALLPDRWEWPTARRWMTNEVVAVSQAALAADFDEVIVADSHGNAHNIEPDRLPERVRLVRSWPRPLLHMQGVEVPGVAACAFVGAHTGASNREGLLAHGFHGSVFRAIRLNGVPCSEGTLNASLAGEFGVPVVFVSGDQHTVAEAERYAPGAGSYVSKHAIGWRAQSSLPPAQVCRELGDAAARAFAAPFPAVLRVEETYTLELEMTTQLAAELLDYLPLAERTGAYTIQSRFDTLANAMRFISFVMLYSPTGAMAL